MSAPSNTATQQPTWLRTCAKSVAVQQPDAKLQVNAQRNHIGGAGGVAHGLMHAYRQTYCNRAVTCYLKISFLLFVSFRFSLFLSYSFSGRCLFSLFSSFLSTKISHRDFITRNQSVGKVFPPFPLCLFLSLFFSPFASSPFLESQTCFSVLSSKVSYQLSLLHAIFRSQHAFALVLYSYHRLVSLCSRRSLYTGNTCCLFIRLVFCTVSNRS